MVESPASAVHANDETGTTAAPPLGLVEQAGSGLLQRNARMFRSESMGGGWEGSHHLQDNSGRGGTAYYEEQSQRGASRANSLRKLSELSSRTMQEGVPLPSIPLGSDLAAHIKAGPARPANLQTESQRSGLYYVGEVSAHGSVLNGLAQGSYIANAGGGIGMDAMEAGLRRNTAGRHEEDDAKAEHAWQQPALWPLICVYFRKMRGDLDFALVRPPWHDMLLSWAGSFLAILAISGVNQALIPESDLRILIASFGASAVLLFGVIESKLAQPRNFVGGQMLCALVGCICRLIFKDVLWLSAAVGMSVALLFMIITKTVHPPGGATALIAATANPLPKWAGFIFLPAVAISSMIMLFFALAVNNLHSRRRYPTYWWGADTFKGGL